jgi:hypothetical protein
LQLLKASARLLRTAANQPSLPGPACSNAWQVMQLTMQREGARGFYKGQPPGPAGASPPAHIAGAHPAAAWPAGCKLSAGKAAAGQGPQRRAAPPHQHLQPAHTAAPPPLLSLAAGLLPSLMRVIPQSAVTLLLYENVVRLLGGGQGQGQGGSQQQQQQQQHGEQQQREQQQDDSGGGGGHGSRQGRPDLLSSSRPLKE